MSTEKKSTHKEKWQMNREGIERREFGGLRGESLGLIKTHYMHIKILKQWKNKNMANYIFFTCKLKNKVN